MVGFTGVLFLILQPSKSKLRRAIAKDVRQRRGDSASRPRSYAASVFLCADKRASGIASCQARTNRIIRHWIVSEPAVLPKLAGPLFHPFWWHYVFPGATPTPVEVAATVTLDRVRFVSTARTARGGPLPLCTTTCPGSDADHNTFRGRLDAANLITTISWWLIAAFFLYSFSAKTS